MNIDNRGDIKVEKNGRIRFMQMWGTSYVGVLDSVVGVMEMVNIALRAGFEPTPPANIGGSMLTITFPRLPEEIPISIHICPCGFLP